MRACLFLFMMALSIANALAQAAKPAAEPPKYQLTHTRQSGYNQYPYADLRRVYYRLYEDGFSGIPTYDFFMNSSTQYFYNEINPFLASITAQALCLNIWDYDQNIITRYAIAQNGRQIQVDNVIKKNLGEAGDTHTYNMLFAESGGQLSVGKSKVFVLSKRTKAIVGVDVGVLLWRSSIYAQKFTIVATTTDSLGDKVYQNKSDYYNQKGAVRTGISLQVPLVLEYYLGRNVSIQANFSKNFQLARIGTLLENSPSKELHQQTMVGVGVGYAFDARKRRQTTKN
jgi:hypothetical protein